MSLVMTAEERDAFLKEKRIGVVAIERDGRAPLAVPVWYDYVDGEILIWMDRGSVKDKLIRAAGRLTLVAQHEEFPYRYVSAEGPVLENDGPPTREQALGITSRYLPEAEAVEWVNDNLSKDDSVLVRMRPQRWLSTDYRKLT